MSKQNNVTLYSNGIGHFRRNYLVPKAGQTISIPFKKEHIGDVAASLQVYGNVRLDAPPSFTPSNVNATSLQINPHQAYQSLLTNLSGSAVKITATNNKVWENCTLLGLETEDSLDNNGATVAKNFAVFSTKNGEIKRQAFQYIEDIEFTEDAVKAEIAKALSNNFQQIRPESTSLDLSISAIKDEEAASTIQYTIPVAAWKMRYSIREEKGKFFLEGSAIIDNNTDENWDNFVVSVVTGNPISFNTDIATTVVPLRKFVRLVETDVQGNVEVQDSYGMALCASPAAAPRGGRNALATRGMSKCSVSNYSHAGFGLESMVADSPEESFEEQLELAVAPGVDSKDVGDFCVFTSKEPITILARKSAVVPMFNIPLAKAGVVLLYKEVNHATRPYRSVKFKNESEYSLGRGKTVIYNEGVFSGECVLEMTKPGENRMLPHCLENGVKITKNRKGLESKRVSLHISNSVGITEDVSTATTEYVLENKKNESFSMAVEHTNELGSDQKVMVDFEGVEFKDKEKLTNGSGYRLYFDLKPKQSVTIKVSETLLNCYEYTISNNFNWIKSNIIDVNNPLATDKAVLAAVKIQQAMDEVSSDMRDCNNRKHELETQSNRVRSNISSTKDVGNSSTIAEWVKDLDEAEKEIRGIDKTHLPKLNKKFKELQDSLRVEIAKISATWKNK